MGEETLVVSLEEEPEGCQGQHGSYGNQGETGGKERVAEEEWGAADGQKLLKLEEVKDVEEVEEHYLE